MKSRKDSVDSPTDFRQIALALIKKEDVSNSYLHIFFPICVSVNYYSHPGLLGASSGFNAISLVGT